MHSQGSRVEGGGERGSALPPRNAAAIYPVSRVDQTSARLRSRRGGGFLLLRLVERGVAARRQVLEAVARTECGQSDADRRLIVRPAERAANLLEATARALEVRVREPADELVA